MIVLDANILIRAVLGRRVQQLLQTFGTEGVRFFAPDRAFEDAETYLPALLEQRSKPMNDVSASLDYLKILIEVVEADLYAAFEEESRERLRGRDEDDWPVLATALGLGCPIWTEDMDFFGLGVAVWTTSRVEIYLRGRSRQSRT